MEKEERELLRKVEGALAGKVGIVISPLAEIAAFSFFEDGEESTNWKYCMDHASFGHKECCEFILHIGNMDHARNTMEDMARRGCTRGFINAYRQAALAGAIRVLFHAS